MPKLNNKITVLHTRVVTGTGGGPEKTIINSPRFMVDSAYHLKIAYLHPPNDPGFDELQRRARESGTELISIPDRGLRDVGIYRKMSQLCKDLNVTIWHGHDYKTNALGVLLKRRRRLRLVTTLHGWVRHTKRTPLYYWIDKRSLRYHDHVISVSQDLYDQSLQMGVPRERSSLVSNAIDFRQYERSISKTEARASIGIESNALVVGAVGRLSAEKGFGNLIRACAQLVDEGHDLVLVIAGDGDDKAALLELIEKQKNPERFKLLGYVSDMLSFYQAIDLFALSSLREGLPNVVLEAMSSEVPVVATRVAGVPEMITHEESGMLCEATTESLIESIRALCKNEELRHSLAKKAKEIIRSKYDFGVRMKKIEAIYDEVTCRDRSQCTSRE